LLSALSLGYAQLTQEVNDLDFVQQLDYVSDGGVVAMQALNVTLHNLTIVPLSCLQQCSEQHP
jgi:hypothetical protein